MKGIYHIIDKRGKQYIGSSKDIDKRLRKHLNSLRRGDHHNIYLQRAFKKYGEDFFTFEAIEETDLLFEREQWHIDNTEDLYNIGAVGGGDNYTNHPNKEQMRERLITQLMECKNPEPRYGEDNPNWKGGHKFFCECGAKIGGTAKCCGKCRKRSGENNPFHGKTHTQEVRDVIKTKAKARYANGGKVGNERAVYIEGVVYPSLSEAHRQIGVSSALCIYRIKSKKYDYHYVSEMPNDYPEGEYTQASGNGTSLDYVQD